MKSIVACFEHPQVTMNGKLLFSKLKNGFFPDADEMAELAQTAKDLDQQSQQVVE
jgi:hypothetical protein